MTDAIERIEPESNLTTVQQQSELSVEDIVARVEKVREVHRRVMKPDQHFGIIPGTSKKPTLLKPGAELLRLVFRLDAQDEVIEKIQDGEHLTIVVRCTLYHIPSGARVGSGLGSCSTLEAKYRWRKGGRVCPECNREGTIIKGRPEYGGGWICFAKKGGCGAKWPDGATSIESQDPDRVPNPDVADTYNTVLKMACKRAEIAATLAVTCASEIFTQDVEDFPVREAAERKERGSEPPPAPEQQAFGVATISADLHASIAAECKRTGIRGQAFRKFFQDVSGVPMERMTAESAERVLEALREKASA